MQMMNHIFKIHTNFDRRISIHKFVTIARMVTTLWMVNILRMVPILRTVTIPRTDTIPRSIATPRMVTIPGMITIPLAQGSLGQLAGNSGATELCDFNPIRPGGGVQSARIIFFLQLLIFFSR